MFGECLDGYGRKMKSKLKMLVRNLKLVIQGPVQIGKLMKVEPGR